MLLVYGSHTVSGRKNRSKQTDTIVQYINGRIFIVAIRLLQLNSHTIKAPNGIAPAALFCHFTRAILSVILTNTVHMFAQISNNELASVA